MLSPTSHPPGSVLGRAVDRSAVRLLVPAASRVGYVREKPALPRLVAYGLI